MDVAKLRDMSAADLRTEIVALRREQMNLRLQLATGQSTKTDRVRAVRRDIARCKTFLRAQEAK
ncbi:MAG: 50S ribosomal protein L29 [Oceanococcaceae bacterium]